MDTDPEAEKPKETSTADIIEEFLRETRDIHKKHTPETKLDYDAVRIQVKEFADLETQIMATFPNGVMIDSAEANLPFNPQLGLLFRLFPLDERYEPKKTLNQLGVSPRYRFDISQTNNPDNDKPAKIPVFYFDELGNYLKVYTLPHNYETNLEQIPLHPLPGYSVSDKVYRAEMTPEDFEIVGFVLTLIRNKFTRRPE